jgi:hypothetical protein
MTIAKVSATVTIAGFILALGTTSRATIPTFVAGPTETYEFIASGDNPTNFNGSTVTIDGTGIGGIASFDLYDDGVQYTGSGTYGSVISYNTSGWDGGFNFSIPSTELSASGTADYGSGDSLTIGYADPPGNWNLVTTTVPDAGSTFEMLLAGVAAMGVYQRTRGKSE